VLEKEGLKVTDVLIILDRQQGGVATLKAKGITVHSVMTMEAILNYLITQNVINDEKKEEIVRALTPVKKVASAPVNWSLDSRVRVATNPIAKKLMEIMLLKKTNLCIAADFTTQEQILKLAAQIGAHICMLKLHVDIISDFSADFIDKLTQIANDNNFVIFEDRKLADTGKTVELQLTKGVYSISSWAHLVTVHSLPGQSVLQGLAAAIDAKDSALGGCLLIAQLSTKGTLTAGAEYLSGTMID
uniref:orotidine-5'-phosphate decarboxylase n=1 Tax=Plectus sambesii TaxID=2011161 RepID=A0A914UZA8_9BILA